MYPTNATGLNASNLASGSRIPQGDISLDTEITQQQKFLEFHISTLDESLHHLATRLQPVLRDIPPSVVNGAAKCEHPPACSALSANLLDYSGRLHNMQNLITALLDRLAL